MSLNVNGIAGCDRRRKLIDHFLETLLELFHKESGLKINFHKSIVLCIGKWKHSSDTLLGKHEFVWAIPGEYVTYLGISLTADFNLEMATSPFEINEWQIRGWLQGLRYQRNSVIGNILILRSLIASRLVYKFQLYPLPSQVLNKLNKLYMDFVWDGHHRIAAHMFQQPNDKGGLNMLSVHAQSRSLQWRWIKQLVNIQLSEEK